MLAGFQVNWFFKDVIEIGFYTLNIQGERIYMFYKYLILEVTAFMNKN